MKEFLGKKINGEISHYSDPPVEQADPILFIQALEALFSQDNVEKIRWHQYTPYFNDGDACTFSVYDPDIKFKGDDDGGDYETGWYSHWDLKYSKDQRLKDIEWEFDIFSGELQSGRHEKILSEKFGDPAEVTVYLNDEGEVEFSVEFYEHD